METNIGLNSILVIGIYFIVAGMFFKRNEFDDWDIFVAYY